MTQPLTDAINALTRYANETTGASDQTLSEAVGTLVAGYGGGGGLLALIDETTISESARAVTIDVTQYLNYDLLVIAVDFTMSANTWLYFSVDTINTSNHQYQGQSTAFNYPIGVLIKNKNLSTYGVAAITDWNHDIVFSNKKTVSSVILYAYEASTVINAGSKVKIYGAKYTDM